MSSSFVRNVFGGDCTGSAARHRHASSSHRRRAHEGDEADFPALSHFVCTCEAMSDPCLGHRYYQETRHGARLFDVHTPVVGNAYLCTVSDPTGERADIEEEKRRCELLRMEKRGRTPTTRAFRREATTPTPAHRAVVAQHAVAAPLSDASRYVSDAKGLFRDEVLTHAHYAASRTGRRPFVALIDHDENGAIEYYKHSNRVLFEGADFLVVNDDAARCANLRQRAKANGHGNVRVECGTFAEVIACEARDGARAFDVLWVDGCARVRPDELAMYARVLARDGGFLAYTMPTRPLTVDETLARVRALNAACGLDDFQMMPYRNTHTTMVHASGYVRAGTADYEGTPKAKTAEKRSASAGAGTGARKRRPGGKSLA